MPKDQPNFPLPDDTDFYFLAVPAKLFRELDWYADETGRAWYDVGREALQQFVDVNIESYRGSFAPESGAADAETL